MKPRVDPMIDESCPDRLIAMRDIDRGRKYFSDFDWQLEFLRKLGEELYEASIELKKFRSNLARVSVQCGRARRIMWDESFFDMILLAQMTGAAAHGGQDARSLTRETAIAMLRDGGTALITSQPYRALVMQEVSNSLRHGQTASPLGLTAVGRSHVENMFRLVRNFCLLHEIGHLAEGSQAQSLVSDHNFETIKSIYLSEWFKGIAKMTPGGGDANVHHESLRRAFENAATQRELRADIYAIRTLLEFEFRGADKFSDAPRRDKVLASLLLYEGLAILHYVQSNMGFISRYAGIDDNGEPEDIKSERESDRMTMLRGDVRLFLATLLPHQLLGTNGDLQGDEESLAAFAELRPLVPGYSKEYLRACRGAIEGIASLNRSAIFTEESRLKIKHSVVLVQRDALRNIGWIG